MTTTMKPAEAVAMLVVRYGFKADDARRALASWGVRSGGRYSRSSVLAIGRRAGNPQQVDVAAVTAMLRDAGLTPREIAAYLRMMERGAKRKSNPKRKTKLQLPRQWTPARIRIGPGGKVQVGFSAAEARKINPGKPGSEFKRCVKGVSSRGGAYDPRAVCAAAGRRKYGAKKFQSMALAGKLRVARRSGNPRAQAFFSSEADAERYARYLREHGKKNVLIGKRIDSGGTAWVVYWNWRKR